MSYIHFERREIHLKVVYFGPHRAGKTTTIHHIHGKASGKPVAVPEGVSAGEHCTVTLGTIRGFVPHLHLHATSGAPEHARERAAVLEKSDGIVFVADASPAAAQANRTSYDELSSMLATHGLSLGVLPLVLQINKQDLPDALAAPTLASALGLGDRTFFGSIATTGAGVFDALKEISRQVLQELRRGGEKPPPSAS